MKNDYVIAFSWQIFLLQASLPPNFSFNSSETFNIKHRPQKLVENILTKFWFDIKIKFEVSSLKIKSYIFQTMLPLPHIFTRKVSFEISIKTLIQALLTETASCGIITRANEQKSELSLKAVLHMNTHSWQAWEERKFRLSWKVNLVKN